MVKHIKELNRSKSKISSREYKVSVIQMVEQKLYGDAKSVICVKNKRRNAVQVAKSKMNAWPNRFQEMAGCLIKMQR